MLFLEKGKYRTRIKAAEMARTATIGSIHIHRCSEVLRNPNPTFRDGVGISVPFTLATLSFPHTQNSSYSFSRSIDIVDQVVPV
jgi:hypothetical protein